MENEIILGNCLEVTTKLPPLSIDAVVTSPPYAEQRKGLYESINELEYPKWTVQWMNACIPALKPNASIAIVIRPHISHGQISDYILKTRLAVREAGWYECEELIWVKPNSPPMGNINRPRRAWESILWFSRSSNPFCNPKANGTPSNRIGLQSKKGVGEYKSGVSEPKTGIARCRDYVEVGTSGVDRSEGNTHPAQYPSELAAWIIRLLSPVEGTILDPFIGSGSTAVACLKNNRKYIGIDTSSEYCEFTRQRIIAEMAKIPK